jgi:hypothetical protein
MMASIARRALRVFYVLGLKVEDAGDDREIVLDSMMHFPVEKLYVVIRPTQVRIPFLNELLIVHEAMKHFHPDGLEDQAQDGNHQEGQYVTNPVEQIQAVAIAARQARNKEKRRDECEQYEIRPDSQLPVEQKIDRERQNHHPKDPGDFLVGGQEKV